MEVIDHRMVWRRARPSRAAMLIPSVGAAWTSVVKRALESMSLTWGGCDDVLVPVIADNEPHSAFRSVLRAHDPDYVASYLATAADVANADPALYQAYRAGRPDTTDLREQFETETQRSGWWDLSDAVKVARSWCSPFSSEHAFYPKAYRGAPIEWPLVPLSAFPDLLSSPLDLDLAAFDPMFELMVRMRLGGLPSSEIHGGGSVRPCIAGEADVPPLSELACTNTVAWNHPPTDSPIRHLTELHSPGIPPTVGIDPMSPIRRTAHGMKRIGFELRNTWLVVVGETCEDFCFALACDRLLAGATWLPQRLIGDSLLANGLLSFHSLVQHSSNYANEVAFTSLSLGSDAVNESRLLALSMDETAANACSKVVAPADISFGLPRRLADPGSLHLGETSICYRDSDGSINVATALITPIPEVARSAKSSEVAWEVDVDVEHEQALARGVLGPADLLSRPENSPEVAVRSGTMSMVYHSHRVSGISLAGWALEQHLVTPSVRVPSASVVVSQLALAAGYTIRPSQTGRLNRLVIDMWGSLDAAASDLSSSTWPLLDALTPRAGHADGDQTTHLVVHGIPYVTSAQAQTLLGFDEEAMTRAVLDRLLRLEVLRRGLVLRCARCNWLDWCAIEDIGRSFSCTRCPHDNFLEQDRWREPAIEPHWFYDLDHAVGEALNLNGRVPILALDWLRTKSRRSFSFLTDFEVMDSPAADKPPEIDFAVVSDGRLILGEAKKNDKVASKRTEEKRKIGRLRDVASLLTADTVCFATSAVAWDAATVVTVDEMFGKLGIGRLYAAGLGSDVASS